MLQVRSPKPSSIEFKSRWGQVLALGCFLVSHFMCPVFPCTFQQVCHCSPANPHVTGKLYQDEIRPSEWLCALPPGPFWCHDGAGVSKAWELLWKGLRSRTCRSGWELGFSVFNHFCICAFCFFKLEVRYLLSLALKLVDQLRIIRRLAHSQPISNSFKAEETRSGGTKL